MEEEKHKLEQKIGVYYAPWEKTADRIITPFERFVHRESTSSLFLVVMTILALVFANSMLQGLYYDITHIKLSFSLGPLKLEKTLHHWVNDGLMVLFFFVVGLELKREILVGELASLRKAALPIVAAVGGMITPALIYYAINPSGLASQGWAIPMATDIAFAIGAMVLLGNRVPRSLMAFLVALAIADDLGAVMVIALFYTETLFYPGVFAAIGFTGVLVVLNFIGVRWAIPYFLIAVLLWFAMLYSGVHATLAGVIGAFAVPARPKYDPEFFREQSDDLLKKFDLCHDTDDQIITNVNMKSIVQTMEELIHSAMTPLQRLQHIWHMPVAFFVIPVFAFFNAGVPLNMQNIRETDGASVMIGIVMGLVLGKFLGITLACWVALKLRLAQLPNNVSFSQIAGASLLAGIGFTMSIFIAGLAFEDNGELLMVAKIGILIASLFSGLAGYVWLWVVGKDKRYESGSIPT
jgi:NhaA family Na+:H+ antiporter